MIKAVVFDLDDTLFPEMEYVKSGFRAVADFLIRETNKDYYEELIKLFEKDKKDVFDRLIKNNGIKIEVNELIDIYRNHKPTIRFYDDVMPFINELKAKAIKTGIITDGRPEGQRAKLEALKCYSIFDKIIITDELGGIEYRKPHPLSYEKMAKGLNVNYDEMMYIGDNPSKDFGISEVYPIKTVWVKRKNCFYADNILIRKADYTVNKIEEISMIIKTAEKGNNKRVVDNKNSMNIMQMAKHFGYSGVSTHIVELSKQLKENGHNVIIVTSDGPIIEKVKEAGIKFYLLPFMSKNLFVIIKNIVSLYKIVKKENIDIAHTHWRITGVYLRILSLFKKIQYVWTNHLNHIPTDFLRRIFTFYGECAITVSNDMVPMLNGKLKIPRNRIKVVFNGINENEYYKYEETKIKELKEHYKIKEEKIISLLGRLERVKGHLFLLDSLAVMEKDNPTKYDWKLLITGKSTDKEYIKEIINKATELNLIEKISFVGYVNPVDILNITDVMVLPSSNEGFPIVCVEAFAMNVPVVRTKVGGYYDMKKFCFGAEYGDKQALSCYITKCLEKGDEIKDMVNKAYNFYYSNCTNKIMGKRIEQIYKNIEGMDTNGRH